MTLADAVELYAAGEPQAAYEKIAGAMIADPDNPRLPLVLCKLLRHEARYAQALTVIQALPAPLAAYPEISQLRDQLEFHQILDPETDMATLEAQVVAEPAAHSALAEEYQASLQQLAAIIEQEPEFEQGDARQAMLRIFNLLGEDHPLISQYRGHWRGYAH